MYFSKVHFVSYYTTETFSWEIVIYEAFLFFFFFFFCSDVAEGRMNSNLQRFLLRCSTRPHECWSQWENNSCRFASLAGEPLHHTRCPFPRKIGIFFLKVFKGADVISSSCSLGLWMLLTAILFFRPVLSSHHVCQSSWPNADSNWWDELPGIFPCEHVIYYNGRLFFTYILLVVRVKNQ